MLSLLSLGLLLTGSAWMAEFYFGFRFEGMHALYPFAAATRHAAGFLLFALGSLFAWLETRREKLEQHRV